MTIRQLRESRQAQGSNRQGETYINGRVSSRVHVSKGLPRFLGGMVFVPNAEGGRLTRCGLEVVSYCGRPSTAKARNFAYLSPILLASLYSADSYAARASWYLSSDKYALPR